MSYVQSVLSMKDKFNYSQCIRRRCQECKRYDICFGYRGAKKSESKNIRPNK